jgi:hypothetical protein
MDGGGCRARDCHRLETLDRLGGRGLNGGPGSVGAAPAWRLEFGFRIVLVAPWKEGAGFQRWWTIAESRLGLD